MDPLGYFLLTALKGGEVPLRGAHIHSGMSINTNRAQFLPEQIASKCMTMNVMDIGLYSAADQQNGKGHPPIPYNVHTGTFLCLAASLRTYQISSDGSRKIGGGTHPWLPRKTGRQFPRHFDSISPSPPEFRWKGARKTWHPFEIPACFEAECAE